MPPMRFGFANLSTAYLGFYNRMGTRATYAHYVTFKEHTMKVGNMINGDVDVRE